ncbi:MAG: two-component system response regulator [Chlamydiae bacterium]|nr:MAG: two-component system response regulator [Chlamydiota bacterium]
MNLLVIDDEKAQRESLTGFLEHIGHNVISAETGQKGMEILEKSSVHVIISDFRMPGLDGLRIVEKVKKMDPAILVILITAYGDVELAVNVMKAGAYDFLTKPIDLDELEVILSRAEEQFYMVEENKMFREILNENATFNDIVSVSSQMENVLNLCARVASGISSVLIMGETGVGKELIARAVHFASPRKDKPFIALNCSALNEHLLESELFGHEKGAFTGAVNTHAGRFEIAHGGTLFFDEIGDMPLNVQVKLLRALQERVIERVGSTQLIKVDVRVITATHRNLEELIEENRFRRDLFYRLNVVPIHIPPLRERREDIVVLAQAFLAKYSKENHREVKGFNPEAIELLTRYNYPGNVRELENTVERAVLLTRSEYIEPKDLPDTIQKTISNNFLGDTITLALNGKMPETVERLEQQMLHSALKKCNGNQTRAANELGISEKSVRDRMKKWNIPTSRGK